MNYRHGFHAGNFADVLKHAVLARMLVHLRAKEKPFRVIDTHAGRGAYDLGSEEARRTGEWRDGIGRLIRLPETVTAGKLDRTLGEFLAPYLEAVAAWRAEHGELAYPGSPAIVRHFLRRDDRLIAIEAQERIFAKLEKLFPAGSRAKALRLDGYTGWGAFVPPKERRGLVIVDPPYEAQDEFEQVVAGLAAAMRKWPTGMTLIWYPLKDQTLADRFAMHIAELALPELWRVELDTGTRKIGEAGLDACGLILVNPPWTLPEELRRVLPALAARLGRGPQAKGSCRRLGSPD
jgi:23S rRNA (adenine2030-N6)-methyltransferase